MPHLVAPGACARLVHHMPVVVNLTRHSEPSTVTERVLVIVNAASRRGEDARGALVTALVAHDFHPVVEPLDDAATLAARVRAHAADVTRVIVAGGDGTVGTVAGAVLGTGLPLGIVPTGTANNLARTLGIPASVEEACALVRAGRTHAIDAAEVNGRVFMTTASIGLSVAITEALTDDAKRRMGTLAYAATAARTVRRAERFVADITWPGGTRRARTVQVVVGNGRFYGSAMQVADDTRIDDHALDLYSLEVRAKWRLLALGPRMKRGTHGDADDVRALRAPEFHVATATPMTVNADGELVTETPATFRVLPSALTVYAPDAADAPGLG